MRVLWIVNCPIGPFARKLGLKSSSGIWLDAALAEMMDTQIELFVATSYPVEHNETIKENGVTYLLLAGRQPGEYVLDENAIASWTELYREIRPDLIQVWGTEYQQSLAALKAKPANVKALLYIQGVMGSVAEHYFGGIAPEVLQRQTSVVERVTGKTVFAAHRRICEAAWLEAEAAALADGIIYETEWSHQYYQSHYHAERFFRHKLPINPAFLDWRWNFEKCVPHSIFTPASDYPLKGVHFLLAALPEVKAVYPDVKLRIPGAVIQRNLGAMGRIKQKAYRRYLRNLIEKNQLWDNVEFTGVLTSAQMAEQMAAANVFVCTSTIENHSSTLREAMIVGTPCITTNVGGIPEYFSDMSEGFCYRSGESRQLAERIIELFSDSALAERFSECARQRILSYYKSEQTYLPDIYQKALEA